MSLDDLLEVPLAHSFISTSATRIPRIAASRAIPAPVMPPPITSTSKTSDSRALNVRNILERYLHAVNFPGCQRLETADASRLSMVFALPSHCLLYTSPSPRD